MYNKYVMKKKISLLLALLFLVIFYFLPESETLSHEALCVIGIFLASLTMWIGVSIDWPSLITILLIGFLPSFGFAKTFNSTFGNSTVMFLLFTFILVYPLSKTNFVRRTTISLITNKIAIKGPWYFVSFLFIAETLLGLFISPSVLFVAFLPFLEDIYNVLNLKKGSMSANMLMLGTAFCISLSSGMTPIGHVWPTLAMGAYQSATGISINQFEYMAIGIPCGFILVALLILVFKFIYKPNDINEINPKSALSLKSTSLKADKKEIIILLTVALVVILWIVPSLLKNVLPDVYTLINSWTTAMPPILGCIILFLVTIDGKPIINFKEASEKGVMWGAILMTGAATLIAGALQSVGVTDFLSTILSPIADNLGEVGIVLFFVAWVVIQTNFFSNIVTTTIVSTIAVSLLLTNNSVNLAVIICLIGFGAAICNMTPAGQSTINTVAIGSGYTTSKDMFIYGAIFAVLAIIVLACVGYTIGTLVL